MEISIRILNILMTDPKKLLLYSSQSPGDIVMLTAAIRDLHLSHPFKYVTAVDTSASAIWENNPYIGEVKHHKKDNKIILDEKAELIECHYPLINHCNRPYHFIHGYVQYLEEVLGERIPVTDFKGDIHLSNEEKSWISQVEETGYKGNFWIIVAGGKQDFSSKWWDPLRYQAVVDYFGGLVKFVQVGEAGHVHPKLSGVIDLVGKTDIRQLIRLVYHSIGVLSPVTFAMHLAAAVEVKPGNPRNRACVVVAGGREPPHWEAYPHHQFIHTNGALLCCDNGGCWTSRCQKIGDGDAKDYVNTCKLPVMVGPDLLIPRCMDMITVDEVIRRINLYYNHSGMKFGSSL
jgi:ADP-heptose:LPS heptosyltransferase